MKGDILESALLAKEQGRVSVAAKKLTKLISKLSGTSDMIDDCTVAMYELALLFTQMGFNKQADVLLAAIGFRYKLNPVIFSWRELELSCHASKRVSVAMNNNNSSDLLAVAFDSVLPTTLYDKLVNAFSPESCFWTDHSYPTDSFFSYNIPATRFNNLSIDANIIEELANYLQPLVKKYFIGGNCDNGGNARKKSKNSIHNSNNNDDNEDSEEEENGIGSIEWWSHCRYSNGNDGHQLHFDTDEKSLLEYKQSSSSSSSRNNDLDRKRKLRDGRSNVNKRNNELPDNIFPIVSSVLYLFPSNHKKRSNNYNNSTDSNSNSGTSSETGTPTLVTNQTLQAGSLATVAYCCPPADNRLLLFDGRCLHGVVPQLPPPPITNTTKTTTTKVDSSSGIDGPAPRITLMIGWWRKGVHCTPPPAPLPSVPTAKARGKKQKKKNPNNSTVSHNDGVEYMSMKDLEALRNSSTPMTPAEPTVGKLGPNMSMPNKLISDSDHPDNSHYYCPYLQRAVHWPSLMRSNGAEPATQGAPAKSKPIKSVLVNQPSCCLIPVAAPIWCRIEGSQEDGTGNDNENDVDDRNSVVLAPPMNENNNDDDNNGVEYMSMKDLEALRAANSSDNTNLSSKKNMNKKKSKSADTAATATADATTADASASSPSISRHSVEFVGKWFVRSLDEIRIDVMSTV